MATEGSIYGFGSCPVDPVGPVYGLFVHSIFHFPSRSLPTSLSHFHSCWAWYDITQVYLRSPCCVQSTMHDTDTDDLQYISNIVVISHWKPRSSRDYQRHRKLGPSEETSLNATTTDDVYREIMPHCCSEFVQVKAADFMRCSVGQ